MINQTANGVCVLLFTLSLFFMAHYVEANEYNWVSTTRVHYYENYRDTAWQSETALLTPVNEDTAMGKKFEIKKCLIEGNELRCLFSIVYRASDVIEIPYFQWIVGRMIQNEYVIDSIGNQGETLAAANKLMDSIPSKIEALSSGDTLTLYFYLVEMSNTAACGYRHDVVFINGEAPLTEVLALIDAYYNKYCPSNPNYGSVQINRYTIYLIKQISKAKQGLINTPKLKKASAPGSTWTTVNGRKICRRDHHYSTQMLLEKNKRLLFVP
jgi:hypothetical protein